MLGFLNYLIDLGYIPYRRIYDKNKRNYDYIKVDNVSYYSSIVCGYTDIRLIKNGVEIIFGLNETNHSPTLIYPRPKGFIMDYQIDRLFKLKPYDYIYNIILKSGGI